MKINHSKFKKLISKIPFTTLDEISILLPDDSFDCKLKKEVSLKPIMFLGLNRSLPHIHTLPYHNMRNAIFETLDEIGNKEIKKKVQNIYLSDFVKYSILEGSFRGRKLTKGWEISKLVRKNPEVLARCGKTLEKEISLFQIKKVFCFGHDAYGFAHKYFKKRYSKVGSKRFSEKINNRNIDFIMIEHYGNRNRPHKNLKKDLRKYFLD